MKTTEKKARVHVEATGPGAEYVLRDYHCYDESRY